MTALRQVLKSQLYGDRMQLRTSGLHVYCAVCDGPILNNSIDMHEVLITRGDVSGLYMVQKLIMVQENCVLVHHGKCHQEAATRAGRVRCIENLIKWNGMERIVIWLDEMRRIMKTSVPKEALHLVENIGGDYELQ